MPATKFTFLLARFIAGSILFVTYKRPGILSVVVAAIASLSLYLGLTLLFNEILSFTLATIIALMLTVLVLCYWIGKKTEMKKEQARKRLPRKEISDTLKAFGIKPRRQDPHDEVEDYSEEIYIFLENLINHSTVETGAELMELAEASSPACREIFEMYRLTSDDPEVLRVRFPCYVVDELVLKKPQTDEESAEIYQKVRKVFTDIHSFYMDNDLEIPLLVVKFDCERPQAINFDQAYTLRIQLYQMNLPEHMKRPVDSRGIPIGH